MIDELQGDLSRRYGGPDPVETTPEDLWPLTGKPQPEAVPLYLSAGWTPAEPYGPAIEFGWTDALAFERHLP